MNENKEELENIYNDLNQKYLDIVNIIPEKTRNIKKIRNNKKEGIQ